LSFHAPDGARQQAAGVCAVAVAAYKALARQHTVVFDRQDLCPRTPLPVCKRHCGNAEIDSQPQWPSSDALALFASQSSSENLQRFTMHVPQDRVHPAISCCKDAVVLICTASCRLMAVAVGCIIRSSGTIRINECSGVAASLSTPDASLMEQCTLVHVYRPRNLICDS
jgi:hypothetical protein